MDIREIECKLIDLPNEGVGYRELNINSAETIAESIRLQGLLNAIVVRPSPEMPDRFILICGRHRLYACMEILNQPVIKSSIVMDMGDKRAELAANAENLMRTQLSDSQYQTALKQFIEQYEKNNPDQVAGKAGGKASAASKSKTAEPKSGSNDSRENQATGATEDKSKPSPTPLKDLVAAMTNKSSSTADRDIRIARKFCPEQFEIFERIGVSQHDQTTVAKIKEKYKRDEVVDLIAGGTGIAEAIRRVHGLASFLDKNLDETVMNEKKKAKAEKQPGISDDEWFEKNCGDNAKSLEKPLQYKLAAILYRRTTSRRSTFNIQIRQALELPFRTSRFEYLRISGHLLAQAS